MLMPCNYLPRFNEENVQELQGQVRQATAALAEMSEDKEMSEAAEAAQADKLTNAERALESLLSEKATWEAQQGELASLRASDGQLREELETARQAAADALAELDRLQDMFEERQAQQQQVG